MGHRRRFAALALALACVVAASTGTAVALARVGSANATSGASLDGPAIHISPLDVAASQSVDWVVHRGFFAPENGFAVANLTLRPGRYVVTYSFEARIDSVGPPVSLECGMIDNNGYRSLLATGDEFVETDQLWRRFTVQSKFSVSDVTLGLNCVPQSPGLIEALFRDVTIVATRDVG